MLVVIAGGHGGIAMRLTRLLVANGDQVRSLIRNADHADDVRTAGAEPSVCDLEAAELDVVAKAASGADAVVFAAGAGAGSGPERKDTMDYGGAVKLIGAAKADDIRRYVIVSSIGANPEAPGEDTFSVYSRAKGRADAELEASELDHTIVRPGMLTDEPGTGRVQVGGSVGGGAVPRDDVAAVLAAVLDTPSTIGKKFELISGEVPVDAALASL